MSEPEPPSQQTIITPEREDSRITLRAALTMKMDFRAEPQINYIIPQDKFDSLEGETETDSSKLFAAAFGVALTLAGVLITNQITNTYIFAACIGLLLASSALTFFFYRQDKTGARRRRARFQEIREKSRTVVALAPGE